MNNNITQTMPIIPNALVKFKYFMLVFMVPLSGIEPLFTL